MSRLANSLRVLSKRVRPGQPLGDAINAETLNAIFDSIGALARGENLFSGQGILMDRSGAQVILTAVPGLGSANRVYPFDISVSGTTATFRVGTVNGLIPSNLGTGVTVTNSGTEYLVLNCTTNNGQITAASMANEGSQPGAMAPTLGVPPTTFKVLIGLLVDGVPYKTWGEGNIQALPVESFRIDRVSPAPGTLPYEVYYTWELSVL